MVQNIVRVLWKAAEVGRTQMADMRERTWIKMNVLMKSDRLNGNTVSWCALSIWVPEVHKLTKTLELFRIRKVYVTCL